MESRSRVGSPGGSIVRAFRGRSCCYLGKLRKEIFTSQIIYFQQVIVPNLKYFLSYIIGSIDGCLE